MAAKLGYFNLAMKFHNFLYLFTLLPFVLVMP